MFRPCHRHRRPSLVVECDAGRVIKYRAIDDRSSHTRVSNGTIDDGCWETKLGGVRKKRCAWEADQISDWSCGRLCHEPTGSSGPERTFRTSVCLFTVLVVGWVREGRLGYPLLLQMQRVMGPLPLSMTP